MVGDVGGAMMFFMAMIATIILGLFTLSYTAHVVLTVIEGTASGFGEIDWPNQPYVDWLWKFFYLAWLVAIWVVPLGLVSQWLLRTRSEAAALPGILATAALLFWLIFPISLLSSMTASSRWVIFTYAVLPRLGQRPGAVLIFYLLTGPLMMIGAVAVYAVFFGRPMLVVPVAAVALAAALLIYSRLFGRLLLQLRFTRDRPARPQAVRRQPMTQAQAAARVARSAPRGDVIRAGELPPVNAPDEEARVGYDVRLTDAPAPAPAARQRPVEPADGGYELADEPLGAERSRMRLPERILNPSEYELRLAGRGRAVEPPERPWTSGVWAFPLAAANRDQMLTLALGFAVTGAMFHMMVSFNPA
jgi:membrane protein implicated in regulation of membrane protease activity